MKNKIISFMLILTLCLSIVPNYASAEVKISKSKATLKVGKTLNLQVTGTSKNVSWTSTNKSVASVSKKGVVTALSKGSATIISKVNKKQYKCQIIVLDPNVDIIYRTLILDGSSMDDYIEKVKEENPQYIDVKAYDKDHISVTMLESQRLKLIKDFNKKFDDTLTAIIESNNFDGTFTKIKSDKLFTNVKIYTDKEKLNNIAYISIYMGVTYISDNVQAINLIDIDKRQCNITLIDKDTGETISLD